MKKIVFSLLFLTVMLESFGQLVRRKDYDAAFALQAGGEVGVLTAFQDAELSLRPVAGLKMTFPFTRKWFLGMEVNYSGLKYGYRGVEKMNFDINQLHLPLYLKYMLNCNKASVLFGFYGSYVIDGKCFVTAPGATVHTEVPDGLENWSAGITVGYEHRILKHLNVMCRISGGMKEVVKKQFVLKDKLFPLQACITLSYDVFRIGDCGCD